MWFGNIRYVRRINIYSVIKNIKAKSIQNEKCDIIIYPYVNIHVCMPKEQKKIITIQDIIPLELIKDKKSRKYKKIKKENIDLMNKTKYLVTISEYSKTKLLEINPNYKEEIVVIPNSVNKLKETSKPISKIIKTIQQNLL